MAWGMVSASRAPGERVKSALDPDIPGSAEFLTAIGRLIAESALAESEVDWWLYEFIGPTQRTAQIIAADLDLRKKMALALALARAAEAPSETVEKLDSAFKKLHALYTPT
jgi:hypothetical protein